MAAQALLVSHLRAQHRFASSAEEDQHRLPLPEAVPRGPAMPTWTRRTRGVDPGDALDPVADRCARWLDRSTLRRRRRFTAAGGEDWWTYANLFQFRDASVPGFYVEVGAGHYVKGSKTFMYDRCLQWEGLCVETEPRYSLGLRDYRTCRVAPVCLATQEQVVLSTRGALKSTMLAFSMDEPVQPLVSKNTTALRLADQGMASEFPGPQHEEIHGESVRVQARVDTSVTEGGQRLLTHKGKGGERECEGGLVTTLQSLLVTLKRNHVDLLVLNMEDPLLALLGIEWNTTTVDVIVLHTLKSEAAYKEVSRYLTDRDYGNLNWFVRSDIWVRTHKYMQAQSPWPNITEFTVPWLPRQATQVHANGQIIHHKLRAAVEAVGLHPREPLHYTPLANLFRQPVWWMPYVPRPAPTATTDPLATQDREMCHRWLDPSLLPQRRQFTAESGADWWTYTNVFRKLQQPGFYVDLGARSYYHNSASYFFDRCLGWAGLCALSNASRSVDNLRSYRTCAVEVAPLACSFDKQTVPERSHWVHTTASQATQTLRLDPNHPVHKAIHTAADYTHQVVYPEGLKRAPTRECWLSSLFSKFNVTVVNLLHAGAVDAMLLRTVDWRAVMVEVIVAAPDPAVARYLVSIGYIHLDQFLKDDLFVHPRLTQQRRLAMSPFAVPYRRIGTEFRAAVLERGLNPNE